MRSHEERIAEVRRRIAEKERQKRRKQRRIVAISCIAACLAVIFGASVFTLNHRIYRTENFYKKIQQACKPGYVLSKECLSFISTLCHHKALAVYPPASGEQPYNAGIHNLTTHKTYGILHYCKTR